MPKGINNCKICGEPMKLDIKFKYHFDCWIKE